MKEESTGPAPRVFTVGIGPEPNIRFSASFGFQNVPHVDMGGGVYLPETFNARFEVKDDHSVEMTISLAEDVPVCDDLRVIRHPDKPSLSGHELRRIPIADWVSYACSMVGLIHQAGKSTYGPARTEGERRTIEGVVRKAKRYNAITSDFLRDVSRVYRANPSAPVQAIVETFGPMAHSTASRYVKLARDAGLLPQTTQGKATR